VTRSTTATLGVTALTACLCLFLLSCSEDIFAQSCGTDSDCGEGEFCVNGKCVASDDPGESDAGTTADASAQADVWRPDATVRPDAAAGPDTRAGADAAAADTRSAADSTVAQDSSVATDAGLVVGECLDDGDCATGLCDRSDNTCAVVDCIYDEHCSGFYDHCSSAYVCVSAHDCEGEMAYIPYPWDDSMTVRIEGDTSDADSNYDPAGSCGDASGPEDIYSLALPRTVQKITVTMTALPSPDAWDTFPYAAASICGGTNLGCVDEYVEDQPEVMVLPDVSDSVITIVADGYSGSSYGPYQLTVTVDECDGAGDCEASEQCQEAATDHSRCVPQ